MKKLLITSALMTALTATSAHADMLGVYAGGHVWDNSFNGSFAQSAEQTTFNLDDQKQGSFYLAFEHPLPFIPNVKVSKTVLDTHGITPLSQQFEFEGQTYQVDTSVDTTFNADYLDYTFYYEVFDNDLFAFDFGLTVRDLSADITLVSVDDATATATTQASGYIPMVYVATEIGIPATDWSIYANGNFLSVDNNTLYDYQVGVNYLFIDNLAVEVGVTLGYRALSLQLEDLDNLYTDMDFKGAYLGLNVHF
jgi:outer membrane protein